MNIDEMRKQIKDCCITREGCLDCPLFNEKDGNLGCCDFGRCTDEEITYAYDIIKACNHRPEAKKETHISSPKDNFQAITNHMHNIYLAKNADYGSSFSETFQKLGLISAVTRLSDKMNRLMSLATKDRAEVKDEKIEDTLLDMANYAILTLIELGFDPNEQKD